MIKIYKATEPVTFLLDSGAAPCLIKKSKISDSKINDKEKIDIKGIAGPTFSTLGTININVLGELTKCHVIPSEIDLKEDGLLGSDFFNKSGAKINYRKKRLEIKNSYCAFGEVQVIPARCEKICYISVSEKTEKDGYIPMLDMGPGLFCGKCIVRAKDGKALLKVFNTTFEDKKLIFPTIEMQDFIIPTEKSKSNESKVYQVNHILQKAVSYKQRCKKISDMLRLEHLNDKERKHVSDIINMYGNQFHLPGEKLSATSLVKHRIITTDDVPVNVKQYRPPHKLQDVVDDHVREALKAGVIKESESPWNAPTWLVKKHPKPGESTPRWRLVLDFRKLNLKTVPDAFPLPNIADILDRLGGSKYFSTFDLASGYHQIEMDPRDAPKTAFSTPTGHWEFLRMPFGLRNSGSCFSRMISNLLSGLQGTEMFVYLDDIIIFATSLKEHEEKINKLMKRLEKANLKLQPEKCEFLKREVLFLGHIVSQDGLKTDPEKIKSVQKFPKPKDRKNIRQFLGLTGYYRRFIPRYAHIAKPLTRLLQDDVEFKWDEDTEKAFKLLQKALCTAPILQYPDFEKPFIITTDASGFAIGAVLSQGKIGKDRPIAYFSRVLRDAELKYETYEKEALAIVEAIKNFRPYVYGYKFFVVTDHQPLVWFRSAQDGNSRVLKWRLKLAEYDYEVIYKPGKLNLNADALSRNPVVEDVNVITRNQAMKMIDTSTLPQDIQDLIQITNPEPPPEEIIERVKKRGRPKKDKAKVSDIINHDKRKRGRPKKKQDNSTVSKSKKKKGRPKKRVEKFIEEEESVYNSSESEIEEIINESDSEKNKVYKEKERMVNIIEKRDLFQLHKDKMVYFLSDEGIPCDTGATILKSINKLVVPKQIELGKVYAIKKANKWYFPIIIKNSKGESVLRTKNNLKKCLQELRIIAKENLIDVIALSKSDEICNIQWEEIYEIIKSVFSNSDIKVLIYKNEIVYVPEEERDLIFKENHEAPIGGHKGVSKTYNRIKNNYYWENLKDDVLRRIQQCLNCQLKKLVRVRGKNPMVITDTPGAAFSKIALDIVGPIHKTSSGNEYILTMQDLLTKYCVAVPLAETSTQSIAEAFINNFICKFGSPRVILTDQGTNFCSELMKKVAKRFRKRTRMGQMG